MVGRSVGLKWEKTGYFALGVGRERVLFKGAYGNNTMDRRQGVWE